MPTHTGSFRAIAHAPILLPVVLALSACGGGSGSGGDEIDLFPPGEIISFAATLEDGSTEEIQYLVHSVTADGDLVTSAAPADTACKPWAVCVTDDGDLVTGAADTANAASTSQAKARPNRPPLALIRVALPVEPDLAEAENQARLAVLRDFYKQLWQSIAERRGGDAEDVAAEIGDMDIDMGALYGDYQQSGFVSVTDYVVFYEQVGENPYFDAQESVEEELMEFFYALGWSQGQWLEALRRQNLDWPRFLSLMAERQDSFADLLRQQRDWGRFGSMGMDAFIARYTLQTEDEEIYPDVMVLYSDQKAAAQTSGADKFHVTNRSWGVRINNVEQSSIAILSSQDKNTTNYHRVAEKTNLCPTKLRIMGRLAHAQADVEWAMKYTEEKHTTLPGTWLSAVGMEFFKAVGHVGEIREIGGPYGGFYSTGGVALLNQQLIKSLSVNVEIKDVKNIGTEAAPRPGFTARVKITPSFLFNSPWVRSCEIR